LRRIAAFLISAAARLGKNAGPSGAIVAETVI
jgi:hypothetical protein